MDRLQRRPAWRFRLLFLAIFVSKDRSADTLVLEPSKDNTLFEDAEVVTSFIVTITAIASDLDESRFVDLDDFFHFAEMFSTRAS